MDVSLSKFFADAVDLQNGLRIGEFHADIGGDKVDQLPGIIEVDGRHQQFVGQL